MPPVQPSFRRLSELRADRALGTWPAACGGAGAFMRFHSITQIVDAAVGRQVAVVGAVVLEELAHLVQPRMDPEADARLQAVRDRASSGVSS